MKYLCLLVVVLFASTALAVPTGKQFQWFHTFTTYWRFVVVVGEERIQHRGPRDLSEEEHYQGDGHNHNAQYDHEAFLGKEQAERFDQLSPAEAKRRLG